MGRVYWLLALIHILLCISTGKVLFCLKNSFCISDDRDLFECSFVPSNGAFVLHGNATIDGKLRVQKVWKMSDLKSAVSLSARSTPASSPFTEVEFERAELICNPEKLESSGEANGMLAGFGGSYDPVGLNSSDGADGVRSNGGFGGHVFNGVLDGNYESDDGHGGHGGLVLYWGNGGGGGKAGNRTIGGAGVSRNGRGSCSARLVVVQGILTKCCL